MCICASCLLCVCASCLLCICASCLLSICASVHLCTLPAFYMGQLRTNAQVHTRQGTQMHRCTNGKQAGSTDAHMHPHDLGYSCAVVLIVLCESPLIYIRAVIDPELYSQDSCCTTGSMSVKATLVCSSQAARKPSCRELGCQNCLQDCTKLILQCPVCTHSASWYSSILLGTLTWSDGLLVSHCWT